MQFKEIDLTTMQLNPFNMFHEEWGLVAAGTEGKRNTMTVGWGALGVLWAKPVAIVFIRPQRFTKEFVEESGKFTLSFYSREYRKALELLGTKSGRDGDKIAESGLTPWFTDGTVAFEEAELVFVCNKVFGGQQFDASKFIGDEIPGRMYPGKDFHYFYVGEIEKAYEKGTGT